MSQAAIQILFENNAVLLKRSKMNMAQQIRLINSRFESKMSYDYIRSLKCGRRGDVRLIMLVYFARFWNVELFELLTPNCFDDVGRSLPVSGESVKQTDVW